MKTKTDASYGVIPIRQVNNSWEVFLIHQYSRIGHNSYWALPKGHPESSETPRQTAERELKEETGMVAEKIFDEPTFNLEYSFVFDGVRIEKTVQFFIGVITEMSQEIDDIEVKEAGWYSFDAAEQRLDYQDMKKVFRQARDYISSNNLL